MAANRFIRYLAKLRRSRGFGVHSPFAFAFLMNVLNERKAAYYAYPELDALASGLRERNENRLMFRLLAYFNPSEVLIIGRSTASLDFAVAKAAGSAVASRSETVPARWPELTIVNDVAGNAPMPELNCSQGDRVIVVRGLARKAANSALFSRLLSEAECGMAFYDRDLGIFVGRKTLPRQDFPVFLR